MELLIVLKFDLLPLKYTPEDVERVELELDSLKDMRFYFDGTYSVPSVTTILGSGADKAAIIGNWRKKWTKIFKDRNVPQNAIDAYFSMASKRGTFLHETIEHYHETGGELPDGDDLLVPDFDNDLFELFEGVMKKVPSSKRKHKGLLRQHPRHWMSVFDYLDTLRGTVLAQERFLFNVEYQIAGTCDLIYEDRKGNIIVADYKFTGYSHEKDHGYGAYNWEKPSDAFHDKWLQLSAYGTAFNEEYPDNPVTHMHLISTHPHGVETFIVPFDKEERDNALQLDTRDYNRDFQSLVSTFFKRKI